VQVVVASAAAPYDFGAAAPLLDDLEVQLQQRAPASLWHLRQALPARADREALAARVRSSLPNLIAIPWDPESAGVHGTQATLDEIARRLRSGITRSAPQWSRRSMLSVAQLRAETASAYASGLMCFRLSSEHSWWSSRTSAAPASSLPQRAQERLRAWRQRCAMIFSQGNAGVGEESSGERSRSYVSLEATGAFHSTRRIEPSVSPSV